MNKTLNIPIELCQWALQNKQIPMLKLYLYLQFNNSGKAKLDKQRFEVICNDLGYKSNKQPRKHLATLREKNWVGYNEESGYHFIRGLERIRLIEGLKRRNAVKMHVKFLKDIEVFCYASVVTNLYYYNKRKKPVVDAKRVTRLSKQSTNPAGYSPMPYKQIANIVVAKLLDLSPGTTHLYKKRSVKLGLLFVKANLVSIKQKLDDLPKKSIREFIPSYRFINGVRYIQLPDLVAHNMLLIRRTSIEQ